MATNKKTMTTAFGIPIANDLDSLTAGRRGQANPLMNLETCLEQAVPFGGRSS